MFSAADLLDVLRRRRTLKSIRPEEPGRLPPGWERWLEAMPAHAGAVTGAPPPAFVDVFAQRPLRAPPRPDAPLTRWQAFATMWRQQWHPALREERGLRVFAMATSVLLHVGFAVLLAWLMYVQLLVLLSTPPGESAMVEVEFLGTGTPDDVGGTALEVREEDEAPRQAAAAPAPAPPVSAPAEATPAEAVPAASPDLAAPELPVDVAAPAIAATVPPLPRREIPTPALPTTSQPLQVTEVDQPDIDFVLPPATTQVDAIRQPELAVPTRDVPAPEVVEAAEADLPSQLPTIAIKAPDATRQVPALPRREIPAPEPAEVARLPARAVPAPSVDVRAPTLQVPDVEVATVPAPAGRPAPPASDATDTGEASAAAPADAAADASADGSPADAATGERIAGEAAAPGRAATSAGTPAAETGRGPETAAAPGGWPSPSRGDDWDDALRNRPGANAGGDAGLFDGTGRPQLAGTGDAGPPGGAPPGSEERAAIDLAKGGTWLKRPPYDYKPTRFDAFWIPRGTLLEEWVRRGIKQVSIPVPGTSMEIVCVVSLLQLGGGCGIDDLNVNDQPSTGKAAPDVPFKPELQENQDALARPPGG